MSEVNLPHDHGQNIEFERCIDFLVRMIDKYGAEVLRELEEEKQNKEEKEAAVS